MHRQIVIARFLVAICILVPYARAASIPDEFSSAFARKSDLAKIPGWVDPLPNDFNIGQTNKGYTDLLKLLKDPPRKVMIPVTKPSRLPWFDVNKIPKIVSADTNVDRKILTPLVKDSFQVEGKIAVFRTSDTHLYYVIPDRWQVAENSVSVEQTDLSSSKKKLRFLLTPSYAWTNKLIAAIKSEDPYALFVPLPKKIIEFRLDVPEVFGRVTNQILPTDGMSIGDQIYMSLDVNDDALELFKLLNDSKSFLTGSVTFTYPYDERTDFKLVSDIWLNL